RGATAIEPIDLLAALVDEAESQAAVLLAEVGLDAVRALEALGTGAGPPTDEGEGRDDPAGGIALPQSPALRVALNDATVAARSLDRGRSVGTEHLLAGLLAAPGPVVDLLAAAGIELDALADRLTGPAAQETATIPLPV